MEHSIRVGPQGHPSDLLHWPPSPTPTPSSPKLVILFIPGNPGLPQYYIPFLTELQKALPAGQAEVYALGHLGHSPAAGRIWTGGSVASLREQVEHKLEFVEELREQRRIGEKDGAKLVLMGHSIGSWIICEMFKRQSSLITSAHLLFPTISHMRTSTNGRRLAPTLFRPLFAPPLALATSLLSLAPSSLLKPIVALAAGQRGQVTEVTTAVAQSPGIVVAMLTLAGEEMREVRELDEACLKEYGGKMRWYWAKGEDDGWVADSSVREIEGVLDEAGHGGERRVRCDEGMVHAFVLNAGHVDSLARKCAKWIRDDCNLSDA